MFGAIEVLGSSTLLSLLDLRLSWNQAMPLRYGCPVLSDLYVTAMRILASCVGVKRRPDLAAQVGVSLGAQLQAQKVCKRMNARSHREEKSPTFHCRHDALLPSYRVRWRRNSSPIRQRVRFSRSWNSSVNKLG